MLSARCSKHALIVSLEFYECEIYIALLVNVAAVTGAGAAAVAADAFTQRSHFTLSMLMWSFLPFVSSFTLQMFACVQFVNDKRAIS